MPTCQHRCRYAVFGKTTSRIGDQINLENKSYKLLSSRSHHVALWHFMADVSRLPIAKPNRLEPQSTSRQPPASRPSRFDKYICPWCGLEWQNCPRLEIHVFWLEKYWSESRKVGIICDLPLNVEWIIRIGGFNWHWLGSSLTKFPSFFFVWNFFIWAW